MQTRARAVLRCGSMCWLLAAVVATMACGELIGLDGLQKVDCIDCANPTDGGCGACNAADGYEPEERDGDAPGDSDASASGDGDAYAPEDGDAHAAADSDAHAPGDGNVYDSGDGDGRAVVSLNVQIASSMDDAEESLVDGAVYLDSSDLELTYDDYVDSDQTVGVRFAAVAVPRGVEVTRAYIQFTSDDQGDPAAAVTVHGQASDNARFFANSSKDITSRPRTLASSTWNLPAWGAAGEANGNEQTPELKGIVQEIVNRPGWASGNAMVFIVAGKMTATARSAAAYDGRPASAARLHVEYR